MVFSVHVMISETAVLMVTFKVGTGTARRSYARVCTIREILGPAGSAALPCRRMSIMRRFATRQLLISSHLIHTSP